MNEMNDMRDNRDYNNRGYDNRYYDENIHGNIRDYRDDYRDYRDYRDDYNYRRGYDRRGGRINNRNYRIYRNYREEDYYDELEMTMEDMKEQHRKLEDIAEMAHSQQDKNMLIRIAQKEKENYNSLKQLVDKQM